MPTIFIESEQLKQMMSYKPYAKTKGEKKKVKNSLLTLIEKELGDKWYRLKEGTRHSFDMMCFLSAELGFFYASDEYLADRHSISDRTIRTRMAELIKLGQVIKVHRRSRRCNGKGKPVYLFVNHPYFAYWTKFLGLGEIDENSDKGTTGNAENHANFHTENEDIRCESKGEGLQTVPTFFTPEKQESNNNISVDRVVQYVTNRINDAMKKGKTIEYLSSYVNRVVSSLERQALVAENMRREKARKQQQEEQLKQLRVTLGIKEREPKVPFYNWLVENRSAMPN